MLPQVVAARYGPCPGPEAEAAGGGCDELWQATGFECTDQRPCAELLFAREPAQVGPGAAALPDHGVQGVGPGAKGLGLGAQGRDASEGRPGLEQGRDRKASGGAAAGAARSRAEHASAEGPGEGG